MELTKEHFDQVLSSLATKADLKALATKKDLDATEIRVIARIGEAQEELARIVTGGFEDIQQRLDVRERIVKLESEMQEIRSALHLSNS